MRIRCIAIIVAYLLNIQYALAQTNGCTPRLVKPKPRNLHCGEFGHLTKPAFISSLPSRTIERCENHCIRTGGCHSFGFNNVTNRCNFYSKPLIQMGYVQRKVYQNSTFYAVDCFTTACPPTDPPPGPPAGPCDVLVPPAGDLVTNGGFECGIKPWGVYLRDETTTYNLGPPAFEGTAAFTTSSNDTYEFVATTDVALSQYLYPVPGVNYTLSFERKYTGGARTFVFVDYGYLFQSFGASEDYVRDSGTFVTSKEMVTLQLSLRYAAPDSSFSLDNVSVKETVPDAAVSSAVG